MKVNVEKAKNMTELIRDYPENKNKKKKICSQTNSLTLCNTTMQVYRVEKNQPCIYCIARCYGVHS